MSLHDVVYSSDIYRFLSYSIRHCEERNVLDCGAGGRTPPLGLFHQHGFKTRGVDISMDQIASAKAFEEKHGIHLNIELGDMRELQYGDSSFSCVYSWLSSIHLSKKDTAAAVQEMLRVLKPGGLMYINFIWEPAKQTYLGEEREPGECWMIDHHGDEVLHCVFTEEESDNLLGDVKVLYKNKKLLEYRYGDEHVHDAYIDYIIQKE